MRKYILLIFSAFILMGCPLESKFALPNDGKVNKKLLDTWVDTFKPSEKIIIEKASPKSYLIIVKNLENGEDEKYTAHSTTIRKINLMNIIVEEEGEKMNLFYGFWVKGNKLEYAEVNYKIKGEEDFTSQEQLVAFFKNNIEREDFFKVPTILKRVKN